MSKKANPTAVGGFVLGGLLLLMTGVALFGGGELFAEQAIVETYFEEDTAGLRIGSNVMMNGVRIGYVSDIALLVDEATYETMTRVTMKTLPETFVRLRNGTPIGDGMHYLDHEELVRDAGLRAVLEIESIVTGQLQVALVFSPEVEPVFHGKNAVYPEIPAKPSSVQELLTEVRKWASEVQASVDIGELSERITSILVGLDDLVHSETLRSSLVGIDRLVNNEDTQQLSADLRALSQSFQATASEAATFFETADSSVRDLQGDLEPILARLEAGLTEAEATLAAAKVQLRGDTQQMRQLQSTLEEVDAAARTMREFFDYLERNPEAILKGKQQ